MDKNICKHFNIDSIISREIIYDYLKSGLKVLVNNYENRYSKEVIHIKNKKFNSLTYEQQVLTLELLGSIRKYLINKIFKCYSNLNQNEYQSVGTGNITSDYDISLFGVNSYKIMWKIFIYFLNKYKNVLPISMDCNLYITPIFIYKTKNNKNIITNKNMNRLNFKKNNENFMRYFIILPETLEEILIELRWASIKLIGIDIPKSNIFLVKLINLSKKYKSKMDQIYNSISNDSNINHITRQYSNQKTKEYIKKYYLQYLNGRICYKYIYNNKSKLDSYIKIDNKLQDNLLFYINTTNYFSIDSYYTCSAVNTIVVENQMQIDVNYRNYTNYIIKSIYIVSAVENFGDLLRNLINDTDKLKVLLIKNAKYLYRIYTVLGKIDSKYDMKAKNIKNYIFPYRKTYNIKNVNVKFWKYLIYNGRESKKDYISKLIRIISKIINEKISDIDNLKNMIMSV